MKLLSLNLPSPPRHVKAANDAGWIPETSGLWGYLPGTTYDYASAVGDGLGSSVLMSPIRWVQRTFPEAPFVVKKEVGESKEIIDEHPLAELMEHPTMFYTGNDLLSATLYSYIVDGNAYWRKVRGPRRDVIELWYVPHWLIEPKWPVGGNVFITHYDYNPGGGMPRQALLPEDVVHFRFGINPRNTRKGMSQVYSELREIFGDDQAANFTASLLKNMGVPGLLWSPEGEGVVAEPEVLKSYLKHQFSGDRRGEPLVASIAAKIQQFGFDPKSMVISELRDIAEERVCAALGVRASVVGYGSGLQTTKVGATMSEDVRLSWTGCIIPTQKAFAMTIQQQLLPDFETNLEQFSTAYDLSNVEALKENRKLTAEAYNIGVAGGWIQVAEAREAFGLDVEDTDRVYLRSLAIIEQVAGEPMMPPTVQPIETVPPKRLKLVSDTDHERRVIASAPEGTATRDQRALMARFVRDAISLEPDMEDDLSTFFEKMGRTLADIALNVMEPKQSAMDELMVERIMDEFDEGAQKEAIEQIGRAHYLRVAKRTYDAIKTVTSLAVDLPDFRARDIMALGGRRLGLVDLSDSVRKRLFRELTTGRSLGEGPAEIARRIRDFVPAGTWSSPKVRARVIARTETLHAQRASALEAYKDAPNVTRVMIFDGRLSTSDELCQAMDGKVVELSEAWDLMNDEHPNGTRNFAPVVD